MNNLVENTVEVLVPKSQSLKLGLEKLEGGYISDVSGKRKIYKDADAVLEGLNLYNVVDKLDHAQYHMNIQIIHNDDYQDFVDLTALHSKEVSNLAEAKEAGVIEEAVKFNPFPKVAEPDLTAPIKVTAANAYSIGRLKAINWKQLHEDLPMLPSEITALTGMNTTTLYASLPKARKGLFTFQNTQTRIGFTILAQYYEKTLGLRTSTKDSCEKMKEDMLKMIREIEVISSGKPFVKTSEVTKRLIEMRKTLL